jgi:hypothetical protein
MLNKVISNILRTENDLEEITQNNVLCYDYIMYYQTLCFAVTV